MIDELDTFNACATLALARVARFPGLFTPALASEVAPLARLSPVDWKLESAAAGNMFGASSWFGADPSWRSVFSVYQLFWKRFPVALEDATIRVTVNAPPKALRASLSVVTDSRVGPIRVLPDTWALPEVDDVVLFSEDGWSEAEQARLASQLDAGSTVTLVRPGERCRGWFEACRVKHDFSTFLGLLGQRVELEKLHHSAATEPVMLTVFGVKAAKL